MEIKVEELLVNYPARYGIDEMKDGSNSHLQLNYYYSCINHGLLLQQFYTFNESGDGFNFNAFGSVIKMSLNDKERLNHVKEYFIESVFNKLDETAKNKMKEHFEMYIKVCIDPDVKAVAKELYSHLV